MLQTVWSYKELRNALTKDGWNKSHFQVEQSEILQCVIGKQHNLDKSQSQFFKTSVQKLFRSLNFKQEKKNYELPNFIC